MKSYINMSRPTSAYLAGLGTLMVTSLVLSNIPGYGLSSFVDVQYIKYAAAVLFATGGVFGLLTLARHMARVKEPHRVPQSQVSILFIIFLVCSLLGIFVSH